MPAFRVRTQLTVQAPPALLARLRAAAADRRQTVTAVVIEALESLLAAPPPGPADADGLVARVADLERRVAALERRPTPAAPPPPAAAVVADPAGAVSGPELARRAGLHASGLNRWAATHPPGSIWEHPAAGAWRLLGKRSGGRGARPAWLWAPVTPSHGQTAGQA